MENKKGLNEIPYTILPDGIGIGIGCAGGSNLTASKISVSLIEQNELNNYVQKFIDTEKADREIAVAVLRKDLTKTYEKLSKKNLALSKEFNKFKVDIETELSNSVSSLTNIINLNKIRLTILEIKHNELSDLVNNSLYFKFIKKKNELVISFKLFLIKYNII